MPIGSAKIGVLGAGLVPGGTQTFNASGTFTVPPGVKKVNITGKGGTGNPGNAGNAGNSGNPGTGGGGGSGGSTLSAPGQQLARGGGAGGWAIRGFFNCNQTGQPLPFPCWANILNSGRPVLPVYFPSTIAQQMTVGGSQTTINPGQGSPNQRYAAESGISGNAGQAGQAGNPGNTGNTSSGLCKNFTGGAGGNAGVAGAAGNGGSGGNAGGQGNLAPNTSPGSAGNGGGAGGAGASYPGQTPGNQTLGGAGGGGGAGINSDGSSGVSSCRYPTNCPSGTMPAPVINFAKGGDGNTSAPFPATCAFNNRAHPAPPVPTSMIGGSGGRTSSGGNCSSYSAVGMYGLGGLTIFNPSFPQPRDFINQFNPAPERPSMVRAGGGGGGTGALKAQNFCGAIGCGVSGGGGGGGGRGNAGNAGGNSSAPSGSAANPATFNCVPVTPGAPYPITVASPGGQIVISWNPQ